MKSYILYVDNKQGVSYIEKGLAIEVIINPTEKEPELKIYPLNMTAEEINKIIDALSEIRVAEQE